MQSKQGKLFCAPDSTNDKHTHYTYALALCRWKLLFIDKRHHCLLIQYFRLSFFSVPVSCCVLCFISQSLDHNIGKEEKFFFRLKGEEKTSKHETRCKKYMRRLWAQLNVKQMQTILHMNWGRRHLFDKLKFVLFVCFVLFLAFLQSLCNIWSRLDIFLEYARYKMN